MKICYPGDINFDHFRSYTTKHEAAKCKDLFKMYLMSETKILSHSSNLHNKAMLHPIHSFKKLFMPF